MLLLFEEKNGNLDLLTILKHMENLIVSFFFPFSESSIIMHSKTAQDIFECWRDTEWQLLQAQKSQQIHRGKESSTFHIVVDK
jgi:hypothetical protein